MLFVTKLNSILCAGGLCDDLWMCVCDRFGFALGELIEVQVRGDHSKRDGQLH